jgi:acylphosphatase
MNTISKHLIISGRVQGVGFRHFTYKKARELGIKGWVKNLQDGTVETFFTGSPEDVNTMKERLKEGPVRARVQKIEEVELTTDNDSFNDFSIRR